MNALFKVTDEHEKLNKIVVVLSTLPESWEAGYTLAKMIGSTLSSTPKCLMEMIVPKSQPEGIEIVNQKLEYDHNKRPSASQKLVHVTLPGD